MGVFINYLQSALNNIRNNKMYAAFYVIITVIIFVFITILLQMAYVVRTSPPPFINAARTINVYEFKDQQGEWLDGINAVNLRSFMENMHGWENYAISASESISIELNGKIKPANISFVNADFWTLNEFDFIKGRYFTDKEIENRTPIVVITQSLADRYFQHDAVGKQFDIQGQTYHIIGVVADYSSLANPLVQANVWVPYVFNKYIPSGEYSYAVDILFPKSMPVAEMKQHVYQGVQTHFQHQNQSVDFNISDAKTIREMTLIRLGGGKFVYAVWVVLLFLLIIPAVNIITLNSASADSRMQEIAIRRAIGASGKTAFFQIIFENFILVMSGVIMGIILTYPVSCWINRLFLWSTVAPLTTSHMNFLLITGIILLGFVFTILSGALPACLIISKNISIALKGGPK